MNSTMCNRAVTGATHMYAALNGVCVIYKPYSLTFKQARATIISNLCEDLNKLNVRAPIKHVSLEGPTSQPMKVVVHDSYADNPLVVGPRYQFNDFKLSTTNFIHQDTCGVMVCGINKGNSTVYKLMNNKSARIYRVIGMLGKATDNYFYTGKIVEKVSCWHVTRGHIDKLCSSMQSSHQRKMFELCGVDMESQAAYEMAVKGLIRPKDSNIPMLYSIKCIHFRLPHFTLEIACINEQEMYLKTLIHEIGIQLHSAAMCTNILCIQDGLFNVTHALLSRSWRLNEIVANIKMCQKILQENPDVMHQKSPTLVERSYNKYGIPSVESNH